MFEIMLSSSRGKPTGGAGMFVGEVSSAEFITGTALASQIGITQGTVIPDAGWLHFEDEGKTKYISKKPLRSHISWDSINAVGAVFGSKTVVINGDMYKVRLLSGANANPSTAASGSFDHPGTHGSEWNRLLYHISAKPFRNFNNKLTSEGIQEGDWASYAEADIGMALAYLSGVAGYGAYQWCQETGTTPTTRVCRGDVGVSYLSQNAFSGSSAYYGWRAVLELME